MAKKDKCMCMPGMGALGVILMVLGIYFLVWGFMLQWYSSLSWTSWSWPAMINYLIGLVLFGFGKMSKHRGYECCNMHSMR